jgi:hypothetical protein
MAARIEMEDRVFGRLVVIGVAGLDARGNRRYECLCECGKSTVAYGCHLRLGRTRSCGCLSREVASKRPRNPSAESKAKHSATAAAKREARFALAQTQKFGRLRPLTSFVREGVEWWSCACEWGGSRTARTLDIRSGSTRSCGCLQREHIERLKREESYAIERWRETRRAAACA